MFSSEYDMAVVPLELLVTDNQHKSYTRLSLPTCQHSVMEVGGSHEAPLLLEDINTANGC